MSTLRNPVGPQPPSVYWRRRIMVLLGLIAVIVVVVLIVVRPGAAEARRATRAIPARSPTPLRPTEVDRVPVARSTTEALLLPPVTASCRRASPGQSPSKR